VTTRGLRLAESLGLETTVYTVNEPDRKLELAEQDVTGIFSDRPDLVRAVLARHSGRERVRYHSGTGR
jgi:glycerophosphoryl diester phosphodiesterase